MAGRRLAFTVLTLLLCLSGGAVAQPAGITVPPGFTIEKIATIRRAREIAVAPNGDLFVATSGSTVYVIPDAQGTPGAPMPFVSIDDAPVAGVTLDGSRVILGSQQAVWEVPYRTGERQAAAAPRKLAGVRPAGPAGHDTTSVAVARGVLYASIGSSCNSCQPERDPTRATIQMVGDDGRLTPRARNIRNAIALAVNPQTDTLWAGVAGQDELPHGHPYEIFDPVTLHPGVVDYGWPYCYENHQAAGAHDCSAQTVPRVVFPAYATPIGAVFYPLHPAGPYAFPAAYRGGAFVTLHGSWHQPPVAPRVAFVPMNGDAPVTSVDWNDPTAQWREFAGGFQAGWSRIARPAGIAVGSDGSLFISDDQAGGIYRIRPSR
jgi:glucose/arabinose dehydrogenase